MLKRSGMTESDWSPWHGEGEKLLADGIHPFYPFSQVEFRAAFPHVGGLYWDIQYQVYAEGAGWQPWACGGETAGLPGVPIQGIRMRLLSSPIFPVCP